MSYSRYEPGEYRPQFGGFSFFPPVIKALLLTNVVAFILQIMIEGGPFTVGELSLSDWFILQFYLWPVGSGFEVWQLVTYMFLHGGIWHIFFNMLMLWMFGMEVEHTWGSQKFLVFYIACGLAAGLANLLVAPAFTSTGPTIGASGSVYGVLVAFAMMFPNRYIYLYFLLPIKAKYLITFFIALELFNGITGTMDGVAHMAHLGGAVLGAIWVLLDSRGVIDRLFWRIQSNIPSRDKRFSSRGDPAVKDATFYEIHSSSPDSSQNSASSQYQKVIDEILDKISKNGYSALTEDEKRLLLDASRRIHPDKGNGE